MKSANWVKKLASRNVSRDRLQKTPISLLRWPTAHDLNAAEEQHVVDKRHQARRLGDADVLRRHDERAVFGAQP